MDPLLILKFILFRLNVRDDAFSQDYGDRQSLEWGGTMRRGASSAAAAVSSMSSSSCLACCRSSSSCLMGEDVGSRLGVKNETFLC